MTVTKKQRLLFVLALALTLLHTQFFAPGVLKIMPFLEPYRAVIGVLEYLPAFLGMLLLGLAIPWAADKKNRILRALLLLGAIVNAVEYAVVLFRGNSVYLWQILVNMACLLGPTAALLALYGWLKRLPDPPGRTLPKTPRSLCLLLLVLQGSVFISHLSLLLTNNFFYPIDLVTFEPTPWYYVQYFGQAVGTFAFWLRPLAVLLLLFYLTKVVKYAE